MARALVESKVAACVNVIPGVRSVYRWKGAIEEESEWMLVIKSSRLLFDRLQAELRNVHKYDLPEVLAIPVVDGSTEYLGWLDRELLRSDTLL